MTGLRLAKLPDRTPARLTISITPELHRRLQDYAAAYAESYGVEEPVTELVPAMLAGFLDADRSFARRKK
ncbi:DUF2274 domain-containing protein [Sphingomonas sp. UNC305MFCol5.2]|uniref:DUF2274 domain-containing protein n=1 Tax=Sphingomonas sp. UNC305MFCol5.2 TaxID=1449076 RepID=UPI0004A6D718|nr:DUF2274 domain-containing protein [Sphingomonas sp. UNC305MFCol5.2]